VFGVFRPNIADGQDHGALRELHAAAGVLEVDGVLAGEPQQKHAKNCGCRNAGDNGPCTPGC